MIVVLLALILFALLFPGVLRFLFLAALALVAWFAVMEVGMVHAQQTMWDTGACKGDRDCITFIEKQKAKESCIDRETGENYGRGSVALAESIAQDCMKKFASDSDKGITEEQDRAILSLRAQNNFKCRSTVDYGSQMVCN